MRIVALLLSSAAFAGLTQGTAPSAKPAGPPRLVLQPAVIDLNERSTITVSDVATPSLQLRLVGATRVDGSPFPWHALARVGRVWRGTLPTPALRGLYRIELRSRPGAPPFRSRLFLHVFAPATMMHPSFAHPADVVRWWVHAVPHAMLAALKPWERPAFDHRDWRLHRLFVVAYNPPRQPGVHGQLGMFITVFRDGSHARWRLLEATVEP